MKKSSQLWREAGCVSCRGTVFCAALSQRYYYASNTSVLSSVGSHLLGHRSPGHSSDGYEGTNNSGIFQMSCKYREMTLNRLEMWPFTSAGVWHRNCPNTVMCGGKSTLISALSPSTRNQQIEDKGPERYF
jgi:hypothetical protein